MIHIIGAAFGAKVHHPVRSHAKNNTGLVSEVPPSFAFLYIGSQSVIELHHINIMLLYIGFILESK